MGLAGERAAEARLAREGWIVVERRLRLPPGELDLVALDGKTVVFVEVKTRRGTGYGTPAEAVTRAKRERLARAATSYLARRGWGERFCRFDVIEVFADAGGIGRIHHIRDAFRP